MRFFKFLLMVLLVFSCKNENTATTIESVNYSQTQLDVETSVYPEAISKVFKAHGGIDQWQKMNTLEFTIPKESGNEITLTDLHNRSSLITMPKHTIGYNGQDVWLHKKDTTAYKGNPKFYYNLMFYFYAMPFVLADDGIKYENVKPLEFEGKSYPGIKITYESGIGESPDDEYILYYNSETNTMAWLAYTVTYFSKEKSKDFHFIQYSDWQMVNTFKLPKVLTWYHSEDNKPTTKRNELKFSDIKLSEEVMQANVFSKPEAAEIIN